MATRGELLMRVTSRRAFLAMTAGVGISAVGLSGRRELTRSHYQAIVVGSGYGGGVSALRLGQAGVRTLVLEKGRLWDTPDADGSRFSKVLPCDNRAGWFTPVAPSIVPSYMGFSMADVARHTQTKQPVQAGICEKSVHGAHSIFRGIAVGGGSMVNAAVAAIPTPAQVREAFPDIDTVQFLRKYMRRAEDMLRISHRDMSWFEQTHWYQYARVARQYAANAGYSIDYTGSAYSFEYMEREDAGQVPRSALALEQQFGNNYGRVGSVDRTYLAAAQATGNVLVRALTEVTAIRREPDGEWVVSTRTIDRWGKMLGQREIGCEHLYLNAGVLGTVKLLLQARDTGALPDLSDEIGCGYGNNGDVMVAHMLKESDPAGTHQSIMGLINIDGRYDPSNPVFATIFSIPLAVETHALAYYAMVKTDDRAEITYDRESDTVTVNWPQAHTDHLFEKAHAVFDSLTGANGVDYREDLFEGSAFAANTVHPMGGCVRGKATDSYGRLKGYQNLYVNDASLIPGYLGCNPFMTVTALAEHNMEAILQNRR